MNAKIVILIVGGALCAGGLWLSYRASGDVATAKAATAASARKREHVRDEIQRVAAAAEECRARRAGLESALADAAAKQDRLKASLAASPARPPTPRELMLNDPTLQAMWLAARQARLSRNYSLLYQRLGLTPAQIDRFQAAMTKHEEQMMDLAAIAEKQDPESRAAVNALRKKAAQELDAVLQDILGADGRQRLTDYDRAGAMRAIVGSIAGTAAMEGIPLSPTQAEQLTAILGSAAKRNPSSGSVDLSTVNWDAVDAEVQRLLSPQQLAVFRRSRVEYTLDAAIDDAKRAEGLPVNRG